MEYAAINKQQWDDCIDRSLNGLPYACSWYLDAVTGEQWHALVLNDYDAVFPLPYRKKLFIPIIYQPFFTQQLGLFVTDIDQFKRLPEFLAAIPTRFLKVQLHLNTMNEWPQASMRLTHHISLNREYASIYKQYSSVVTKNLKRITNKELTSETSEDIPTFLRFLRDNLGDKLSDLHMKDWSTLEKLLQALLSRKKGMIRYALDKDNNRIGATFLLISHRHIIYLMAASTPAGKKLNAMTLLIDDIICEKSGQDFVFDFEGSMIPGIAQFYRNFGAHEVRFPVWKKGLF